MKQKNEDEDENENEKKFGTEKRTESVTIPLSVLTSHISYITSHIYFFFILGRRHGCRR